MASTWLDVSTTLDYALSGRLYEYYLRSGKQYMVIGQVDRSERNKPADITSLYVRNNAGNLIQLDNLVTMTEICSPPTLYHYNRYKSATVSATLAQGKALGEGIAEMRKIAKKVLDVADLIDEGVLGVAVVQGNAGGEAQVPVTVPRAAPSASSRRARSAEPWARRATTVAPSASRPSRSTR